MTHEMMQAAFRSSTLERVDWNADLVRGELAEAVQQLKRESERGLFVGGVQLPLALAELGLIDEYEFVVHPALVGQPRADVVRGAIEACRLEAGEPARVRVGGGGDAVCAETVTRCSPIRPDGATSSA